VYRLHALLLGELPVTGLLLAGVLASTWTLSVERDEKAATCPDAARLRRAIAERLGKDPFLDAPPPVTSPTLRDDEFKNPFEPGAPPPRPATSHQQLLVRFSRDPGHLALVTLRDVDGRETGRRELTSSASDCAELAGAVVLAAAIVIDPLVLTRPATPPPPVDAGVPEGWATLSRPPDAMRPPPVKPGSAPPPQVAPPPVVSAPPPVDPSGLPPLPQPPQALPMVVSEPPRPRPELPPLNAFFVGAGGGVSALQVATVAALAQVSASWTSRTAVVGLGLGLTSQGGVPVGVGAVRAMLFDAALHGCLKWKVLGGCAVASVGSFQAWSEGLPNPRPRGTTYVSAGLGGLLDVRLMDLLRLRLLVTAVLQPNLTIAVGGQPVFSMPGFGLTAALSLHFRVWGDPVP
jgi:hypothetical protein